MHTINLSQMPKGQTYEDRYQGYLDTFKEIATERVGERIEVVKPPWSWVPLLMHLGCTTKEPQHVFRHCPAVQGAMVTWEASLMRGHARNIDRTLVEVLCSFRPETADALWKCDMQWTVVRGFHYKSVDEFIVTTNGAYHRYEVLDYMRQLSHYVPLKTSCLLVPCAADKPYPAPMHQMCLNMLPKEFYLMNATGVVGLVPQDLWHIMPHYDCGIPNQWRLFETIRDYFGRHQHERVIVYCDFYSETIARAFESLGMSSIVDFVLPVQRYDDYLNLMAEEHVAKLASTLVGAMAELSSRASTRLP